MSAVLQWLYRHRAGIAVHVGFVVVVVAFYLRVLMDYQGVITWGNLYPILSPSQLAGTGNFFWNPLNYNGYPNPFAAATAVNFATFSAPLIGLSAGFGVSGAVRIYIVLSTLFLTESFYLLTSLLTASRTARLAGTAFFLFNPLGLMQLSQGDFETYVAQAFLFLAIYFLVRSVRRPEPLNYDLLASYACLFLTLGTLQFLYLGMACYLVVAAFLWFRPGERELLWLKAKRAVTIVGGSCLALLLVMMPFIFPVAFGSPIYLGVGSTFAQSLGQWQGFSSNTTAVLFLYPYPGGTSQNLAWVAISGACSQTCSAGWSIVLFVYLGFLLTWGFFTRSLRMVGLSLAVVVASILGAGPLSLVPAVPIFLWTHLVGYPILNTSYMWDWIVIGPSYALLTALLVADLHGRTPQNHQTTSEGLRFFHLGAPRRRKQAYWVALAVVTFVLITPVATQGYYNQEFGITNRGSFIPSSYSGLPQRIDTLVGSSSTGVAFFNPDFNLYFNNSSDHFVDPLVGLPVARTAGLNWYGALPLQYNSYFWWLYNLFYNNQTTSLGQLMAIAGMQYLVDLYGANSGSFGQWAYGVNASSLLQYQTGVLPIYSGESYSIYENEYPANPARAVTSLSLVDGNYGALNVLAGDGLNLLSHGLVMTGDLTPQNWPTILNQTSSVFLANVSDVTDLAIQLSGSPLVPTFDFANASLTNDLFGWAQGANVYVPFISNVISSPSNFAVTQISGPLIVPLGSGPSGPRQVWVNTFFSPYGGNLTFTDSATASSVTVNTYVPPPGNENATWRWIELPFLMESGSQLIIQSATGPTNAVGEIALATPGSVSAWEANIGSALAGHHVQLCAFEDVGCIRSVPNPPPVLLPFEVSPSGWSVATNRSGLVVVNYAFFNDASSGVTVESALGGINTIILNSGRSAEVQLTFETFSYTVYGFAIQGLTFVVCLVVIFFAPRIRRQRRVGGSRPRDLEASRRPPPDEPD